MNALWNAPISDGFSSLCARVFSPAAAILENEKTLGTRLVVINPCSPTRIQKIQLKYLHVTCNYVSLNITMHHYPTPPITVHHYTSLHITTYHYTSLHILRQITTHHCPSLHITTHHYTSLSITTHHYTSLHITTHH